MTDRRGLGTRKGEKLCSCGRPVTSTHNRATKCDFCKAADPHYHRTRQQHKRTMYVAIDTEGDDDMSMPEETRSHKTLTLTYNRQDNSGETFLKGQGQFIDIFEGLKWLIQKCSGTYKSATGQVYTQIPIGFHLTYDSAMVFHNFFLHPEDLMIVRKANGQSNKLDKRTPLCNTVHKPDDDHCPKLHRENILDLRAVVMSGEDDLCVLHKPSGIAFTFAEGRRLYLEYRPRGETWGGEGAAVLDIHDVGRAFTGKLEDVLDDWQPPLSTDQREIIRWGKALRKDGLFHEDINQVARYSETECYALTQVCNKLVAAIKSALKMPFDETKLYGSGSIAQQTLKHFGVATREDSHVDPEPFQGELFENWGRLGYFGGLIEAPVVGKVPGHADEVDINSAYPSYLVDLPCMANGHGHTARHKRFTRKTVIPDEATIGYVLCRWSVITESTGPFVVRTKGNSVFAPLNQNEYVVVTLVEYRAAVKQFGNDGIFVKSAIWWVQECKCPNPLAPLGDAYAKRLEIKNEMEQIGKSDPKYPLLNAQQMAIKLVINSVYGKLAQQRPTIGTYTNMHYAAYVTGATRAQLREETWLREAQGGTALYQHTDGLTTIGGNPVDGGSALGAWGLETKKNIVNCILVQAGLMVGGDKVATRGVNKGAFVIAVEQWAEEVDFTTHPSTWPVITVTGQSMMTVNQAIIQNKVHKAGTFSPVIKEVRVVTPKRNFDKAAQLPGMPTAWKIPPKEFVLDVVTSSDDLQEAQTALQRRLAQLEAK